MQVATPYTKRNLSGLFLNEKNSKTYTYALEFQYKVLVRVFPGQSTHCKDPIVQFNKVLKLIDKNGQKCLLCESEGTHCDCMCSNRLFRTALWRMELYKRVGIGWRGRQAAISRCKPQKGCTGLFFTSILCIGLEFTLCIRVIFPFTFC